MLTRSRTIHFFDDGSVKSNGSLCFMTADVGETHTGIYTEMPNDFSDGEITSEKCGLNETKVYYDLDGNHLILWYPCIEGCAQKFTKK
ncbi:hypothetical protein [Changchengzhania lutea]|uniref:hypothetical protein n=1 Tax=Changchengzhania lutea TaxID=2049305 RepID=UPI00115D4AD1|nr:hypothetical protein [Changchengzhania lutea]